MFSVLCALIRASCRDTLGAMAVNPIQQNTGFSGKHGFRYPLLDAIKGVALLWMTAFHAAYDMAYLGWYAIDFRNDPVWTWQRAAIVFLFMFCAGCGQSIATAQNQSLSRFGRRWVQIAGCALLVTLGSMFIFPQSYIFFGVLHSMAVLIIIARISARLTAIWLWFLAVIAIFMPWFFTHLLFDVDSHVWHYLNSAWFNWLGLISQKPYTEDFVPVFPWLGCVWLGCAVMRTWRKGHAGLDAKIQLPMSNNRLIRLLAFLGKHSLLYYMMHQVVLFVLLGSLHYMLIQ